MAVISSLLIGAGSAYMSYRSGKAQTKAITKGNEASTAEQNRQYKQTREDFQPWLAAGKNALNKLEDPLENFYASPDYEFRRSEGARDIGNMYSAAGGGGNAIRAGINYASNLAGGEFGNWWNRTFSQSEAGRGATGTVGMAGQNRANNISSGYQQLGVNSANISGNTYANMHNAMTGGISNALYEWDQKPYWGKRPGKE